MSGSYDDIINLTHPNSTKHPRMSIQSRASIFSPFAALSGHAGAIAETARLTERRKELGEDIKVELDRRQVILLEHIGEAMKTIKCLQEYMELLLIQKKL